MKTIQKNRSFCIIFIDTHFYPLCVCLQRNVSEHRRVDRVGHYPSRDPLGKRPRLQPVLCAYGMAGIHSFVPDYSESRLQAAHGDPVPVHPNL